MTSKISSSTSSSAPRAAAPAAQFVIGIDIGGTKVKAGAVDVHASFSPAVSAQLFGARQMPTPRLSPPAFYDAIARLIDEIRRDATQQRVLLLPIVSVAHPGRFLPDGRLARSTTPNLGVRPNEFDSIHPAEELRRRVGGIVHAENDAMAQMRFGLDCLLRDSAVRTRLLGETVVYLGPGTGMGGGVAQVDQNGRVRVVTDGHLFDLEVHGYGNGTLTAEELFTGPAITKVVAQANRSLRVPIEPPRAGSLSLLMEDPKASQEHLAAAQRVVQQEAEILSALVETIRSGVIVKARLEARSDGTVARHRDEPDRAWPLEDQQLVRGARRFILGGFVGTNPVFGTAVRHGALDLLRSRGQEEVELIQIPVDSADAGIWGIVQAITPEMIERANTLRDA